MEKLVYVDRRNTNCNKWDGQQKMFGEEGLHAMWVADMDFRVPECVVSALREYVESGVYGYYKIPDAYYQAFIDWEREHHGYEVKRMDPVFTGSCSRIPLAVADSDRRK